MVNKDTYDIIIAGHGTGAALAALAARHAGFSVAICAPQQENRDNASLDLDWSWQSVVALSHSAHIMMSRLGIPEHLQTQPARLEQMVLDTPLSGPDHALGLLPVRGETADKTADKPLAHVYSRRDLARAASSELDARETDVARCPPIVQLSGCSAKLEGDRTVNFGLCIDALGAHSPLRVAAEIEAHQDSYKQSAVIAWLNLNQPHGNIARQIFTEFGPLALLPLPDPDRVALIYSVPTARAAALCASTEDQFRAVINDIIFPMQITQLGRRAAQPLQILLADKFSANNLALIGESAHIVHPVAGQGLNLTCRDIAHLLAEAERARNLGLMLTAGLDAYSQARRADAIVTLSMTHAISRTFNKPLLAQSLLRGAHHLSQWNMFADLIAHQSDHGLTPAPALMQPAS